MRAWVLGVGARRDEVRAAALEVRSAIGAMVLNTVDNITSCGESDSQAVEIALFSAPERSSPEFQLSDQIALQ